MKKYLVILVAILIFPLSTLALTVSNVNEFPIVDEPYELTIMACVNVNCESWKENTTMLEYEKETGIRINWIEATDFDLMEKIRLTLISGDTPDIILWYFGDTTMIQSFGSFGTILALNDLIEEHTFNAKNQLEKYPYLKKLMTSKDGNLYTLWGVQEVPNEAIWNKQFLFMPWFEKYSSATGAKLPETLDEYRAMLEYFRDNDMNGNGDPNDEIPLLGNFFAAIEGGSSMSYIMSAFQLWNCHDYYHITDDGKLVFEADTKEYRDGLSYMNKMYEDELYSEEDFILSLNDYRAIINVTSPEDMIVGCAAAPFYSRAVTQSIYQRAYIDFQPIAPLKNYYNPNVREVYQRWDAMYYPQAFICSTCEHPEIAIKWLDYWLSEEGLMRTDKFGIEGRDWKWTDEFEALDGTKPSILVTASLTAAGNKDVPSCKSVPVYYTKELFQKTSADPNSNSRTYHDYRTHLVYAPYGVKGNIPEVVWCDDDDLLAEYSELNVTIGECVRSGYASFILGSKDINNDADWQSYLNDLENVGLSRYLEVLHIFLGLV